MPALGPMRCAPRAAVERSLGSVFFDQ